MFIESLQKIAVTKSLVSFLLVAIAGSIKQYKQEDQDEVPGDNFPCLTDRMRVFDRPRR